MEPNRLMTNELALRALAIIAHALHRPTIDELVRLLGHDRDQLKAILEELSFLTIDDRTSEISFESDVFCKFATTKLRDRREQVIELIIHDLTSRPESNVTVSHLPLYFEQRGKLKEVSIVLYPIISQE